RRSPSRAATARRRILARYRYRDGADGARYTPWLRELPSRRAASARRDFPATGGQGAGKQADLAADFLHGIAAALRQLFAQAHEMHFDIAEMRARFVVDRRS